MNKSIKIEYTESRRSELSDEATKLINASEIALTSSHAPYSHFHVGAALLLDNGEVIRGSNQENASFPIGYCAERTALSARISRYPGSVIKAIAISVLSSEGNVLPPVAPCGMCRQALLEEEHRQKDPIRVYLAGNNDIIWIIESIEALLPFQFDNSIFK